MKNILAMKSMIGFCDRLFIGRLYYDSVGQPECEIKISLPNGIGSSICSGSFQEMIFDQAYEIIGKTPEKSKYYFALVKGKVIEFNSFEEAEKAAWYLY